MKKLKVTAKQSRREGIVLTDANKHAKALARRPYAPGVHGPDSRTRMTDYGKQLREKQKAKRIYGLNERQFSNIFAEVKKKRGNTAEMLIQTLESRLDNVVFRAGLAKTRPAARQTVSHAHIEVNGKKVNVPSYRVRPGDVVAVREHKKKKGNWTQTAETAGKKDLPSWLSMEPGMLAVKVTGKPEGTELQQPFDTKLIVEFYSR
ncbi:30S ribosomal protein S4 [Candidatus Uhrbacteria bacterium]|nr:MAG: 30S ribosomal protein S4 [Candidatus Uhrbacteria bacterium]